MRGAANVVVSVLFVLLGVMVLFTYYSQTTGVTSKTMEIAKKEVEAKKLTEKYIEIATARIGYIDESTGIVDISLFLYNSATRPIFYNKISVYLYKGEKLQDMVVVSSLSSPCEGEEIPPGAMCELSATMFFEPGADLKEAKIKMILNDYPIFVEPTPSPWPDVPLYREQCSSCSECSALLASVPPGTLVVVNPLTASGDCITVSSPGVRIVCRDYIQGNGTGVGVRIEANNVSVERCAIKGFEKGIVLDNVVGTVIDGVALENNIDMELLADSAVFCSQKKISAYGTSGKIVYLRSGSTTATTIQGLWIYGADNISLTGLTLSKTSPALLICSSDDTSVSSATISSTPLGILLINDQNTNISDISVSSDVNLGIKSINSSLSTLTSISLLSTNGVLFESPDTVSVSDLNVS